jgi:hypothetical protein
MILSLIFMVIVGPQSWAVSLEDSLANTKTSQQGGPVGLVMAMLFLVGGAFALILPLVSLVAFLLSGMLGLAAGATTSFSKLTIWGVVSLILAVFSLFGWGGRSRRGAASKRPGWSSMPTRKESRRISLGCDDCGHEFPGMETWRLRR